MADKKQLTFAAILMALIATFFWTQSRVPALDQKAQMGDRTTFSAIAFDVVLPVSPEQPYLERVANSAVNWGYTNWKGMTFGLIFAAAFITFLRLLPTYGDSRFKFLNTLKGIVIGVPLGVCANCSTPIAHGMVRAGTKVETAMATLMSSPTLNIFVLTMTFTLLPFHIAVAKVIGVVLMVLVGIPLLLSFLFDDKQLSELTNTDDLPSPSPSINLNSDGCEIPSHSWAEALKRIALKFLQNFALIIKETLPLMLLAGVLGAIAIESLPFKSLSGFETTLLSLIVISLIGSFLPVPIAFDVIIVSTLLTSGFSVGLASSLLFSLGVFSIYPAMVIARRLSLKLSAGLFLLVATTSTAVGASVDIINQNILEKTEQEITTQIDQATEQDDRKETLIKTECSALFEIQSLNDCVKAVGTLLQSNGVSETAALTPSSCQKLKGMESHLCMAKVTKQFAVKTGDVSRCNIIPMEDIKLSCKHSIVANKVDALLQLEALQMNNTPADTDDLKVSAPPRKQSVSEPLSWLSLKKTKSLELDYRDLNVAQSGTFGFSSTKAKDIGLSIPFDFRLTDFYEPFKYGRGIASSDFNNDGYIDLVFGHSTGPKLFKNLGNGQFNHEPIQLDAGSSKDTFLVTLVDINNDGWKDLFFSTYGGKNYIIPNSRGQFVVTQKREISPSKTNITLSAGFYDKDLDGDLDILLGNWTAGAENQFDTTYSTNTWVETEKGQFKLTLSNLEPGETLSILFSDFNHDKSLDLIVANDNLGPDHYAFGESNAGKFKSISPTDNIIPSTSLTTMSVDTADFNNDLKLDIFTTDMSFGDGETMDYWGEIASQSHTDKCYKQLKNWNGVKSLDTGECETADNKANCLSASLLQLAKTSKDTALCSRFSESQNELNELCKIMSSRLETKPVILDRYIKQEHKNKLLLSENGVFRDAGEQYNIDNSYWSWNSKAADLDNDGWQDILVANGFGFGEQQNEIHSNVFFHNQKGKTFKRETERFGLKQLLNTPSYTYIDIDSDGDLDIVAAAIMAPPQIRINQSKNNRVSFELIDYQKNRFCVGCKITITTNDGTSQIREIKLSGGFMSFDAPVAYFGLGSATTITSISIQWSDGENSEIAEPLKANRAYRISRMNKG